MAVFGEGVMFAPWAVGSILALVGFVIGLIVAIAKLKKVDVMTLLTGWGIFVLFAPAWMVITDLIGVTAITDICTNYINPLVSAFGLGIALWVLIKMVIGMFK